jgi:hypothetical protein
MIVKTREQIRIGADNAKDESGIALVMTLLVCTLLLGLGMSLSTNSMFELEIASNHERQSLAFYAAQTGLERAIDGFRTDYTISTLPADGDVVFNQTPVSYSGSTVTADYTVTVSRRDSPLGTVIYPFPVFYTITSVGRLVPANTNINPSTAVLAQTLSVSPRTLANFTLFYDQFPGPIAFQSTFRLSGRLAVNDPNGVNTYPSTEVSGDFYSAGAINRNPPYGIPNVSGNLVENAGVFDFPATADPFSAAALPEYRFSGTTRMTFFDDGTVKIYNDSLDGGSTHVPMPPNGEIAVTGGDVIVEGTVSGRVTVSCDDDILINGNIRYADQSSGSWDTLALVAVGDIVIPEYYYTAFSGLTDFEAHWQTSYLADHIEGGTFGGTELPQDLYIDATLVALQGSSPAVINPLGRPPGELYIYGNSIARRASVTVRMSGDSVYRGYNENYTENKKLDLVPPPGFPMDNRVLPTFFAFREIRSVLQ